MTDAAAPTADRPENPSPPARAYLEMVGLLGEDWFNGRRDPKQGAVVTIRGVDQIDTHWYFSHEEAATLHPKIRDHTQLAWVAARPFYVKDNPDQ